MPTLDDDPVLVLPDADVAQPLLIEQGANGTEDVPVVGGGVSGEELHDNLNVIGAADERGSTEEA